MDRLRGERALKDRRRQLFELGAQQVSVVRGEPRRWMQLGKKPVEPLAHVAELRQLARKVGERSVQLA